MKKRLFALITVFALLFSLSAVPVWAAEGENFDLFSAISDWYGEDWLSEFNDYFSDQRIPEEWIKNQIELRYQEILADPEAAIEESGWDKEELEESINNGNYQGSYDFFYAVQAYQRAWSDAYGYEPTVAVQVKGNLLSFPDAEPEITDGRTMVPFRAAAEGMGYDVDFKEGTVIAQKGEKALSFAIGESVCRLTAGGETREITMDTAPYIKDDRTYVPVRFFAEAFDQKVKWDEARRIVVIYDREELVDSIDRDYSVVNEWLDTQKKEDAAESVSLNIDTKVTRFSTLDGNREFPIHADAEVLTDGKNSDIRFSVDVEDFIDFMIAEGEWELSDEEQSIFGEVLKQPIEIEVIQNVDEKVTYVYAPIWNAFLLYNEEITIDQLDVWYKIDLSEIYDEMGEEFGERWEDMLQNDRALGDTLGEILVSLSEMMNGYSPSDCVPNVVLAHSMLRDLIGDEHLTQKGSEYTSSFAFSKEDEDLDENWEEFFLNRDIKYFKGNVLLNTKNGDCSFAVEAREENWGDGDILYRFSVVKAGSKSTIDFTIHQENSMMMNMVVTAIENKNKGNVRLAPPEGKTVLPLESFFSGSVSEDTEE